MRKCRPIPQVFASVSSLHSRGRSAIVSYELEWNPEEYLPSQHFAIRIERERPAEKFRYPDDRVLPGLSEAARSRPAGALQTRKSRGTASHRGQSQAVRPGHATGCGRAGTHRPGKSLVGPDSSFQDSRGTGPRAASSGFRSFRAGTFGVRYEGAGHLTRNLSSTVCRPSGTLRWRNKGADSSTCRERTGGPGAASTERPRDIRHELGWRHCQGTDDCCHLYLPRHNTWAERVDRSVGTVNQRFYQVTAQQRLSSFAGHLGNTSTDPHEHISAGYRTVQIRFRMAHKVSSQLPSSWGERSPSAARTPTETAVIAAGTPDPGS